jgi:hypothetical protein
MKRFSVIAFTLIVMMILASLADASPPRTHQGFAQATFTGTRTEHQPVVFHKSDVFLIKTFPTAVLHVLSFSVPPERVGSAKTNTDVLIQTKPVVMKEEVVVIGQGPVLFKNDLTPRTIPVPAFASAGMHNATAIFQTGILLQREPVETNVAVADTRVATTAKIKIEDEEAAVFLLTDMSIRTGVVLTRAVLAEKGAVIVASEKGHDKSAILVAWAPWAIPEQVEGASSSGG